MIKLNIGFNEKDKVHFVFEEIGLRPILFIGTYKQCLIFVGCVSLGTSVEEALKLMKL